MLRSIYLLTMLFCFITAFAQKKAIESFSLKGKVTGRDSGLAILRYLDNKENYIRDTVHFKNGKFEFSGKVKEPTFSSFFLDNSENQLPLILEGGLLTISIQSNDLSKAKITGSASQKERDQLNKKIEQIEQPYKKLLEEYENIKNSYATEKDSLVKKQMGNRADSIKKRIKPMHDAVRKLEISYIERNPDSYLSAFFWYVYFDKFSEDSAINLYNRFSNRVKDSRYGKWDQQEIVKLKASTVGNLAPDFKATTHNGKEIFLNEYRGSVVLLDFWASWCIPCIEDIPQLQELYNKYHRKGFEVITISIDRNEESWKKAIEKENISNWKNILANEAIKTNYPNPVQPIPSQILIDENGRIMWKSNLESTGKELENVLSNYMGKKN